MRAGWARVNPPPNPSFGNSAWRAQVPKWAAGFHLGVSEPDSDVGEEVVVHFSQQAPGAAGFEHKAEAAHEAGGPGQVCA